MNVMTCTARLGADAEQRFTASGESVVSFNGAIDSGFGDKKVTTWIKFIIWGKRGSGVFPFLKKGGKVICTGELTNRKWQDKEGQDRYSLELNVNALDLDSKKPEEPDYPARSKKQSSGESRDFPKDGFDDDVPFVSNICSVSDMIGLSKSLKRSRRGESVHCLFDKQAY